MTQDKIHPVLVGVSGASGSGKSFFTLALRDRLGSERTAVLSQDFYYLDQTYLTLAEREQLNYDHPRAVDFSLLIKDLKQLKAGEPIEHPLYDFALHTRRADKAVLQPADVVIVDGILIYSVEECRRLFDLRIYIDTPLDLCFIRRLQRDLDERGRRLESVISQYMSTVRPMYLQFVEPAKEFAHRIFSGEDDISAAVEETVRLIQYILKRQGK